MIYFASTYPIYILFKTPYIVFSKNIRGKASELQMAVLFSKHGQAQVLKTW